MRTEEEIRKRIKAYEMDDGSMSSISEHNCTGKKAKLLRWVLGEDTYHKE